MKTAAILAFALLLSCLLYSQDIVPALASSSSVLLEENGTVGISPGVFYTLSINLSIPSDSPYQQVKSAQEPKKDAEGNSYLPISATGPNDYFSYSRQVAVQASARTTPSLPASFSVPEGYAKYLSATARTQSDDPEIKKAAQETVAGARTPFEKIARLAMFVNEQMVYDAGLVGQKKDARWVLENRRGVCVEYATLFIALARASGIPARYVNGYSYSDRFTSWMGHAWAEAYIGEWVPVDPTWFEAGSLDALHIEAGKYAELSKDATLTASVSSQYSQVKWDTGSKGGAQAKNIRTLQLLSSDPDDGYSLSIANSTLAPGGSTTVSMSIEGRDFRVMTVSLLSCTGISRVEVENGSQYALLEPGKNATLAWKITAPASLGEGYIYECPLALNSPYLSHKTVSVKIDPRAGKGNTGSGGIWPIPSPARPPAEQQAGQPEPSEQAGNAASQPPPPCLLAFLISIAALIAAFARN